jgi:DNA-binding beta-propeller fold protein YncE
MIIDLARGPDGRPRMGLIRQAPAGCSPSRVALAPDGRSAWVSARGEDALFGFDLNAEGTFVSALVRRRIPVGPAPTGLAIDRDGSAWVAASNRFRPSEPGEIDHLPLTPAAGSEARIVRSPSGRFPRDVSLLPGGGAAVALFGSSGVELLTGP